MTQIGQESLKRDLTVDEEEKAENTVLDFLSDKDDKAVNLSTREEMAYCLRYIKKLISEKDVKHEEEVKTLKDQIVELKARLTEYMMKDELPVTRRQDHCPYPNKENHMQGARAMIGNEEGGVEATKKRKTGSSKPGMSHARFAARAENSGPFIGDFPG